MSENKKEFGFESFDLIIFTLRNIKPLAIITGFGAICSIVVALMITPKYKSSVVMFPTTSRSVAKSLLSSTYNSGVGEFGDEEDSEKLLQVLNSNYVRESVVNKFKLIEHYKIDPNSSRLYTDLYGTFDANVHYRRTEFMSVEISVMDEDPQMAADIANAISRFVDTAMTNIKKERAIEAKKMLHAEYVSLRNYIQDLNDSLHTLQNLGVIDYASQTASLTQAYADALVKNNTRAAKEIKSRLRNIEKYGAANRHLLHSLELEEERMQTLRDKYLEVKVEAEENLPNVLIVNEAHRPEIKAYPRRSFIVVVSTFVSFIFALVLLLFLDRYKSVWEELKKQK